MAARKCFWIKSQNRLVRRFKSQVIFDRVWDWLAALAKRAACLYPVPLYHARYEFAINTPSRYD